MKSDEIQYDKIKKDKYFMDYTLTGVQDTNVYGKIDVQVGSYIDDFCNRHGCSRSYHKGEENIDHTRVTFIIDKNHDAVSSSAVSVSEFFNTIFTKIKDFGVNIKDFGVTKNGDDYIKYYNENLKIFENNRWVNIQDVLNT